jgi:type II secretion system protein C
LLAAVILGETLWAGARHFSPAQSATSLRVTAGETAHQASATLFGAPEVLGQTVEAKGMADISLKGILAVTGDSEHGFAIVTVQGVAQLVAVGGNLGAGRLVAVFPDHVIVEQNGQRKLLTLPKNSGGYGTLNGEDAQALAAAGPPLQDPPADEIKARVGKAVAPLNSVLRAEPLLSDDAYRGLVVNPNGNRFAFEHMGFRAGDSIMAVNGIPLNQDNLHLFADELRTGRPVKVSLMRPGVGVLEVDLNMAGVYVGPKG